jgi:hypothetical protein
VWSPCISRVASPINKRLRQSIIIGRLVAGAPATSEYILVAIRIIGPLVLLFFFGLETYPKSAPSAAYSGQIVDSGGCLVLLPPERLARERNLETYPQNQPRMMRLAVKSGAWHPFPRRLVRKSNLETSKNSFKCCEWHSGQIVHSGGAVFPVPPEAGSRKQLWSLSQVLRRAFKSLIQAVSSPRGVARESNFETNPKSAPSAA